jgi:hypothetical protein
MKYLKITFILSLFLTALVLSLYSLENLSISLKTGNLYVSTVTDNYLFIASGRGVDIYDISNPNNPSITHYLDTPGICKDMVILDTLLYITDDVSGISIYDVSSPNTPSPVDRFISTNTFNNIYVRDSIFSAATKPNGITIFKYTDSQNISKLSGIPLNREVKGLFMKDNLLISGLSNNSGFKIFDISDPSNPCSVNVVPDIVVEDIAGEDTILYIASGNNGIKIYSIKDPLSPQLIATYPTNDYILHLALFDSLLYSTGLSDSIYVINVTNPSNPTPENSIHTQSQPQQPYSNGSLLIAPELSSGEIFDIPTYTRLGVLDTLNPVNATFFSCSLCYVATGEKGLTIMDISNPIYPSIISQFESYKKIESIYISDTLGYLCCGENGLLILNLSDPYNPNMVSSFNTPGILHSLLKKGNVLYLLDDSGIISISIEDISTPFLLDSLHLPGQVYEISTSGNVGFVSCGQKGFAVLNIEDESNISIINIFPDAGFSKTIVADENYLYLGTDMGVKIYDINLPANPLLLSTYTTDTPINDIYIENKNLFTACGISGIIIIDVSDPYIPQVTDSLNTAGFALNLHSQFGQLTLADYYSLRLDSFPYTDTIPPSPVSNLTFQPQDSLIILRWLNPEDSDYKGTRLLFKNDTFPQNQNDGTILVDHSMEPSSPDSFFHLHLPGDSTHYYYATFAYDYAANFSEPTVIHGISATDTFPPDDISIDTFISWSDTIEIRFTTPNNSDFLGVRALYDTTHIPQNIHDGILFFDDSLPITSQISRLLGNVTINKLIYFTFFSKDSIPNFSNGISDSFRIPLDTIPPDEVSIDSFFSWSDTIEVWFITPSNADFVGVRTMYDLDHIPLNPNDGTLFFDDSLPLNSSISRTLGGVILDTTYYFTFFSKDTVPNFSNGVSDSFTIFTDTLPPDTIKQFISISTPSDTSDTIRVSWINPQDPDLYRVKIKWSNHYYPPSHDTCNNFYNNSNQIPGDTIEKVWIKDNFIPGVRYYFSGFTMDKTGNVSEPARTYCLTPKLTTVDETFPVEPSEGGNASWLDSAEVSFTAPLQISSLQTGVSIQGREDYDFHIERDIHNRYIFIPPAFSARDTVTVTLKSTIKDSVGNPFDGNGNGIPDSADQYTWYFYSGLLGDYMSNDTIDSEDFACFREGYHSQDITKETGPCDGTIPYYTLRPDSLINFEDFSTFITMWNWSLDNRGFPEIEGNNHTSLLHCELNDDYLTLKVDKTNNLVGGEIVLSPVQDSVLVKRGNFLSLEDIFLTRQKDDKILISFGIMDKGNNCNHIANLYLDPAIDEITYSYRLTFTDFKKKGKGIFSFSKAIPKKTLISSIRPNPGKRIQISYGIPRDMEITLELYDITGRKIFNLFNGRKKAGYHAFIFTGKNKGLKLPTGIYFIRLKTKEKDIIRNIILLR